MIVQSIRPISIAAVVLVVGAGIGVRAIAQQPIDNPIPQPPAVVAPATQPDLPPKPTLGGNLTGVADPFRSSGQPQLPPTPAFGTSFTGNMRGVRALDPGRISAQTERLFAALSPSKDQVWGYSVDVGQWNAYQARKGTTLNVLAAGAGNSFGESQSTNLIGVDVNGERIDEVAVFSNKSGQWRTQELRVPAKGRIFPLLIPTLAVYSVGRHVYAFSAATETWDTLALPEGKTAQPLVSSLSVVVQDGDSIHVFSAKTGKWGSVNLGK